MSATFDCTKLVVVTDHRDAGLLFDIERFIEINDTTWTLIRKAERLKAGGRAYNRWWQDALATHDERQRLERSIASTRAQTRLGLIAKGNLWLGLHADNTGTMTELPRAVIREALVMLGEVGA